MLFFTPFWSAAEHENDCKQTYFVLKIDCEQPSPFVKQCENDPTWSQIIEKAKSKQISTTKNLAHSLLLSTFVSLTKGVLRNLQIQIFQVYLIL